MNLTVKTLAFGALSILMVGCASQKNQSASNSGSQKLNFQQENKQGGQQGGQQNEQPSYYDLLVEMDANNDGKLSQSEVKGPLANDFSKIDSNGDGFLTQTEIENAPKPQQGGGGQGGQQGGGQGRPPQR